MADDVKLDELLAKQKAMSDYAATLAGETDVERIQQIAAELQRMGEELQALGEQVAAGAANTGAKNFTEVVLTEAQRGRIEAATGVRLESIMLRDPSGIATRTMPVTDPRIIEYYATQEAQRRKAAAAADEELRGRLDAAIAEIEAQGTAAVVEQLEQLKADPNFLGGMLQKK
jgi:hypothetical protein